MGMKNQPKIRITAFILVLLFLLSGCGSTAAEDSAPAEPSMLPTAEPAPSDADIAPPEDTALPEAAKYQFNPHLYVPMLAADIPQDYWDSFYNLCDALRAGETTFACSSEQAYQWATSPVTLNALFPAACMKITGQSPDGSAGFANGVGTIYYQMPIDEYLERQAQFEAMITDLLNTCLDPDDDDFEKSLKLFDYISVHYSYQYDFIEDMPDGANYNTMMTGAGQCIDLAGVYTYLLLQAGVEAVQVGCSNEEAAHEWVYLVIDGKGYHSDVTWSLRAAEEDLPLYYFLMTGARRAETGCAVDDLTAPLLPYYWLSRSSLVLTSEDDSLSFPSGSFLVSIDEENKTVRYLCFGKEDELNYAKN